MTDKVTYTFHFDGGHGWIEVPLAVVVSSGAPISSYSYLSPDGLTVYLEEVPA